MDDDLDQALQVDILSAMLRIDNKASSGLLESLSEKLSLCLPENTTVSRGGWLPFCKRQVQEITISFADSRYQITRQQHGSFTAKTMKIVKGVVLKTDE